MNMGLLMNDLYISVIPSYLCFQLAAAASLHNMVQNNNFVASRLGSSACLLSVILKFAIICPAIQLSHKKKY